jgi:hypothetical protein
MTENPSSEETEDMYAAVAAVLWDKLQSDARKGVLRELSPNDRNEAARAVQHGRRVIRANKQNNK